MYHTILTKLLPGKLALVMDDPAQRLAAQPLGHLQFVVTILAGNYKPQLIVSSLSLG
jgi:hypothetical protein